MVRETQQIYPRHALEMDLDQQPISRVVGTRRQHAPLASDHGPSLATQAWIRSILGDKTTCVPRGLFYYRNHEDMARDMTEWRARNMARVSRNIVSRPGR